MDHGISTYLFVSIFAMFPQTLLLRYTNSILPAP